MRQTTEDAVAALGDGSRPEILQTKIQSAGERRMDGGDMRPTLLAAGEDRDFGLGMAEQNLDELEGRVAGRSQNADAYHKCPSQVPFAIGHRFAAAGSPCLNIDFALTPRQGRRTRS